MARINTFPSERKYLGTIESLAVLLEHRKILSECIRYMDANGQNYISEHMLFAQVKHYLAPFKSEQQKRIQVAFATDNLLQSHIIMDVDSGQGENRLYFQNSVIEVVRLCDVSLFKKLSDVQLKSHLQFLNQALDTMYCGDLPFDENDDDFIEFIDNLLMNIGRLLSDIKRNVVKMQALGKDLEAMTATSVKQDVQMQDFINAKQQWLEQIVKLYARHIMPVLQFLNPDTSYEQLYGLHAVLSKMVTLCHSHQQHTLANNIQSYALSLLNYYQPIEATATAVNRFIHKERDSIKRFNAIEYFYQRYTLAALAETQKDNLNKRLIGKDAIVLTHFSPNIKAQQRPQGYAFNDSPAYFRNLFNELEARTKDVFALQELSSVFAEASKNHAALARQMRYQALINWLSQIEMQETDDVIKMLHARLLDSFDDYVVYDLISAVQYFKYTLDTNVQTYAFISTNRFASVEHKNTRYTYRRVKVVAKKHTESTNKGVAA